MKVLLIAGHGKKRNGTFDPGATGYIKQGEHRYMRDVLFPAMKKYADNNFIYHAAYNVYDYGNLVALARKYGKDTAVIECHFDAGGTAYSNNGGGHVIIYSGYKPDEMDLRLVNALEKTTGLHKSHRFRGVQGLSGRSNLANVNRAANGDVNYRLIEVGMGTNKSNADYMLNNADTIAKALVEAIQGKSVQTTKPKATTSKPVASKDNLYRVQIGAYESKTNADNVLAKAKKAGFNDAFIVKEGQLYKVQIGAFSNKANADKQLAKARSLKFQTYLVPPKATQSKLKKKTIDQLATDIINGLYGNEPQRSQKLRAEGYTNTEIKAAQAEVNRRYR